MKKIVIIVLTVLLAAVMCSCGDNAEKSSGIDVSIKAKTTNDSGTPKFTVTSNLPDNTELLITLEKADYTGQTKLKLKDGKAVTEAFSDNGKALSGDYTLKVVVPVAKVQPKSVQETIGEKGENLKGDCVKESEIEGMGKFVEKEFEFSF